MPDPFSIPVAALPASLFYGTYKGGLIIPPAPMFGSLRGYALAIAAFKEAPP
jgi:hypothetical protein